VYTWKVGYKKEELEEYGKEVALTSKGLEMGLNER
jgi:hypothetical protein